MIDLDKFNPPPLSPEETLKRYRIQMMALHGRAMKAAEEKHPGIERMIAHVARRIEMLERGQS